MDEIAMTVPEEPPERSVILDHEGFAWQRFGRVWVRCGTPIVMWLASTKEPRADWVQLLAAGPVRVIWTPDEEGSEKLPQHMIAPCEDCGRRHPESISCARYAEVHPLP